MRHRAPVVWLVCVASLVTGISSADACWFGCKRSKCWQPSYAHSVYCCVDCGAGGRWCKRGDYVTKEEAVEAAVSCVLAGHSAVTVRYGQGHLVEGKPCETARMRAVAKDEYAYTVHCCKMGMWETNHFKDIASAKDAYTDCLNHGYNGMLVEHGTPPIGDPIMCGISMPPGTPPGVPPKK
jgi:hypothetical protein